MERTGSLLNVKFGHGGSSWNKLMDYRYLTYRMASHNGVVCNKSTCPNPIAGAWSPPLRLRLRLRPRPRPRPRLPPHAIVVKCSSISVLLFNPIYTFVQKNIHTLRPQRKHHKKLNPLR